MNLFRSEEHARNWTSFDPEFEHMLKPVSEWADIFSNPFFTQRGRPDYITWTRSAEGAEAFGELRARLAKS